MQQTTVGRLLIDDALPPDLRRSDRVLDSKGIKALFQEVAEKYPDQYADIALKLTKLGHDFAYSKGGLSFGIEHLRTAKTAKIVRAKIEEGVERIAANPSLDDQAKEDAIIKLTSSFREPLEAGIFQESLDEGNPLAHQILSGVRGNKTNLRSLRGGDLLYVDHRNRTIPVPVVHSYSEGLRPAEYWSSTFGARAGVISTKKATADSGYLCLGWGTKVRMADSTIKSIQDVKVGDTVFGVDINPHGTPNARPVAVLATRFNGKKPCRQTFFSPRYGKYHLSLVSTAEHKLLSEKIDAPDPGVKMRPVGAPDDGTTFLALAFARQQSTGEDYVGTFLRNDEATVEIGEFPTYDIEVDHPDATFMLANGLVVSNSKILTQAAHRLIVTAKDAEEQDTSGEPRGMPVAADDPGNVGALLGHAAGGFKRNTLITPKVLKQIKDQGIERILVRSPIVGGPPEGGVYSRDVGVREKGTMAPIGDYVGHASVQALGEKLTQGQLCLAEGTEVRLADGTAKVIEDIVVGDIVIAVGAWGQIKGPVAVTAVHYNGARVCKIYRLHLSVRGTTYDYVSIWLTCTPAHRVLLDCNPYEDRQNVVGHSAFNLWPIGEWVPGDCAIWVDPDVSESGRRRYEPYWRQVFWSDSAYMKFDGAEDAGELPTYDLTIDDPDHSFLLANGLVVSNSSKHSGGVSGANAATSGFKAIFQLVNPPKVYPGAATHAQQDGLISKIDEAPQGGFNVFVDGQSHYVPADLPVQVKAGDRVEAGDTLSEGMPNPAEVVKHKGIGEGRRYFVDAMRKTYANTGMHAERRNIELLARGLIDHVRLTEELGSYVPDDVVPYSAVERDWEPREGTMTVAPHSALNRYLERPVLHYSIGTRVTPSVAGELSHFGVGKVAVHKDPPPFVPEMQRGVSALQHDPEWAVRHLGSGLAKGTLQAAQRGSTTDTAGTSFVSALAMDPTHFGRQGLTKGWDPNTLGDDDLLD